MKKYLLQTLSFIFLAIFILDSSCLGQANIKPGGYPKLITTQGSQPSDNINCSLQDQAGNLWFGTTGEGIYKYDGKSFFQFTVANGLISNMVFYLLEDKEGKIWICTMEGVCVYDGKTFAEIKIPLRKDITPNKLLSSPAVFSMMQDKNGKLWFATINGVYVYDGKNFTSFPVNEGGTGYLSSNNNVERILEDNAGTIWFGGRANSGVYRYDGKSVTNLTLDEEQQFNWGWPVLQDKNGNIWFSNWQGTYRYDGKSFKKISKVDGLSFDIVYPIIEDKSKNLWFAYRQGGICRYDGNTFTCFELKSGLTKNDIWSMLEDKAGNIWVGTRFTGLFRFDGKSFTSFSE